MKTAKFLWQPFPNTDIDDAEVRKMISSSLACSPIAANLDPSQWLHRSAFSYGGLDPNKGVNSSQNVDNLVLGSQATNTEMLRSVKLVQLRGDKETNHSIIPGWSISSNCTAPWKIPVSR